MQLRTSTVLQPHGKTSMLLGPQGKGMFKRAATWYVLLAPSPGLEVKGPEVCKRL